MRQLREDREGNRFPLVRDGKAIIRVDEDAGLYYGIINDGEVIAISNDIETVYKRLKRADRDINIVILYKNRSYETLESYYKSLLPRIYRITSSNTKNHGLIIAMNFIENNEPSQVELFYSLEELYKRFDGLKNQNYYVYIAHLPGADKERLGGIDALDIPAEFKDIADLRAAIEAKQKGAKLNEK